MYKVQEFQGGSGRWYIAEPDKTKWWYPAIKSGVSLIDWVKLLKSYGADHFAYCEETDVLVYSFATQTAAHKFVLWLNKEARNKGW